MNGASILELPLENWLSISHYLEAKELSALSETCTSLRNLIKREPFCCFYWADKKGTLAKKKWLSYQESVFLPLELRVYESMKVCLKKQWEVTERRNNKKLASKIYECWSGLNYVAIGAGSFGLACLLASKTSRGLFYLIGDADRLAATESQDFNSAKIFMASGTICLALELFARQVPIELSMTEAICLFKGTWKGARAGKERISCYVQNRLIKQPPKSQPRSLSGRLIDLTLFSLLIFELTHLIFANEEGRELPDLVLSVLACELFSRFFKGFCAFSRQEIDRLAISFKVITQLHARFSHG